MKNVSYCPENWVQFIRMPEKDLLSLCRMDVYKATGKGGQKKNKTSNAIRLTLEHLSVTESKSRSKAENINNALKKMRMAIATDSHDLQRFSKTSESRPQEIDQYIFGNEIGINPKNPHYPILVGFLVDCFLEKNGSWFGLGDMLGTTDTQVRRFVDKNLQLKRVFGELKARLKSD